MLTGKHSKSQYRIVAKAPAVTSLPGGCHITSLMISQHLHVALVNVFVSTGNDSLPQPILTQIYVVIWRYYVTIELQNNRV